MKLFLDANVLFTAAHNPQGKAALTIELGKRRHWGLATSHYASEEARRNLAQKFPSHHHKKFRTNRSLRDVEPQVNLFLRDLSGRLGGGGGV